MRSTIRLPLKLPAALTCVLLFKCAKSKKQTNYSELQPCKLSCSWSRHEFIDSLSLSLTLRAAPETPHCCSIRQTPELRRTRSPWSVPAAAHSAVNVSLNEAAGFWSGHICAEPAGQCFLQICRCCHTHSCSGRTHVTSEITLASLLALCLTGVVVHLW